MDFSHITEEKSSVFAVRYKYIISGEITTQSIMQNRGFCAANDKTDAEYEQVLALWEKQPLKYVENPEASFENVIVERSER